MSLELNGKPATEGPMLKKAMGSYVYIGLLEGENTPMYWRAETSPVWGEHFLYWIEDEWVVAVRILLKTYCISQSARV